jgi:hypothetical protein
MSGPFAQITEGPATANGDNTNIGALVFDNQNNIVEAVGNGGLAQALMSALLVEGAPTALTTITTAQNLLSKSIPAGALNKLLRTLRICGFLIYTTPGTTTPAMTIAVKLGAVTLCTITAAAFSSTASTNMPVQFVFTLTVTTTGSSGKFEGHGKVIANISANTPAAAAAMYLDTGTAASSAIDLTIAETLTVTIAANSAISSAQLRQLTVEIVN